MTFRSATPADIPLLLEMEQVYYEEEGYPFDRERARRVMEGLATNTSFGRLLVAEWSGQIAGYMALTFGYSLEFGGRDAFVDELYIAPHARGHGLGTEALAAAERACREAGISALHLEVEFENPRAKTLYERSGFYPHSRHLMTKRFTVSS